MDLAFTRGDGRRHHITAVRDDRVVGYYAMADYGTALPHDMAHVVVESVFDLPWGFWGLVAAGGRFETLNRAAVRTPGVRRTDPLVERYRSDLLVAEGLVNLFHQLQVGGDDDPASYVREAALVCAECGRELPTAVCTEAVVLARRALEDLNARWQSTPAGETLRLEFPLPF